MKSRRTDNGSARGMSVCEANVHSAEALKRARGTLSLPNFAAHGSLSRVILRQTGYTNKNVSVRHIFETNREAKLGRGAPWPTADAVSGLGKKLPACRQAGTH